MDTTPAEVVGRVVQQRLARPKHSTFWVMLKLDEKSGLWFVHGFGGPRYSSRIDADRDFARLSAGGGSWAIARIDGPANQKKAVKP